MLKIMLAATLAIGAVGTQLDAQGTARGGGAQGQRIERSPQDRAQLEQRFRENFAAEVKKRLQLTDDQMTKLMAVNRRLDTQRRELFQQEREARMALRAELANPEDRVNQTRVAELLDAVLKVQRSRLDLVDREQRELASFLTPVQRARFQAFVEMVQRRMDDMDGRRDGRGSGRGGPPPSGDARGAKRPPTPPPAG